MKKFFKWKIIFILILLLAGLLRFWELGNVPGGFHGDESEYGYNAYSIFLTGKDANGHAFPLILQSWGDYKPAVYAYLTIPWIALLDLNPLSVRMTAALFGVLTVAMVYILTNKLLANRNIALLAALFLAISPWHLSLSRTTSEVVVSVFFLLCLIYTAIKLQEKFQLKWLLFAITSGLFAVGSYTASRFFVVILTLLVILFWIQIKNKKIRFHVPLVVLFITFISFGFLFSTIDGTSRFQQINIFSHPQTKLVLEEQIREDEGQHPLVTRGFHNKAINYGRTLLGNYGEYFTLDFLFLNGGQPQRLIVPNTGLFYLWQLPFLFVGLYVLMRKRTRAGLFVLAWWMLLLLPASSTFEEIPNVYRTLIVLPPLLIIIAVGVHAVLSYTAIKQTLRTELILLLMLLGIGELIYFQHQYYVHQELHQPWHREYAYKPLMEELTKLSPNYEKIVVTKSQQGASIAILFWSKYDPATYQKEGSPADKSYGGFGNYIFAPEGCPLSPDPKGIVRGEVDTLYINKGECLLPPSNAKLVKTINWQDGNPAFQILEYVPDAQK
jgi:4-amino-4-deoxy-L-arabinose transferase-like glycosyltransferase